MYDLTQSLYTPWGSSKWWLLPQQSNLKNVIDGLKTRLWLVIMCSIWRTSMTTWLSVFYSMEIWELPVATFKRTLISGAVSSILNFQLLLSKPSRSIHGHWNFQFYRHISEWLRQYGYVSVSKTNTQNDCLASCSVVKCERLYNPYSFIFIRIYWTGTWYKIRTIADTRHIFYHSMSIQVLHVSFIRKQSSMHT